MKAFELVLPLGRDECLRRMRASVTEDTYGRRFTIDGWNVGEIFDPSKNGVLGGFGETSIMLRRATTGMNSFPTCLSAELIPDPRGTRLRCSIGQSSVLTWLGALWAMLSVVVGLKMIDDGRVSWTSDGQTYIYEGWLVYAGAAILPCFGVVLWLAFTLGAPADEEFLTAFLRRTLEVLDTEAAARAAG